MRSGALLVGNADAIVGYRDLSGTTGFSIAPRAAFTADTEPDKPPRPVRIAASSQAAKRAGPQANRQHPKCRKCNTTITSLTAERQFATSAQVVATVPASVPVAARGVWYRVPRQVLPAAPVPMTAVRQPDSSSIHLRHLCRSSDYRRENRYRSEGTDNHRDDFRVGIGVVSSIS